MILRLSLYRASVVKSATAKVDCVKEAWLYTGNMPVVSAPMSLKEKVRAFWNSEPCGTRYLEGSDEFAAHARARYELEPHIFEFAGFSSARGMRVLEVGVGLGADYLEWLRGGAQATGIDLSQSSVERTRLRCRLAGYEPDLEVSDAENLTFANDTFDLVYSYGVMHHSVDVQRCMDEAWRVLKPGGLAKIMLYHHPSITGFLLWCRFGLIRRKSIRQTVYDCLESPGTKSFTCAEIYRMMAKFEEVTLRQVFSPGDLLLHKASPRFRAAIYRLVWGMYPRALVRRLGPKYGLFLLITARKPATG